MDVADQTERNGITETRHRGKESQPESVNFDSDQKGDENKENPNEKEQPSVSLN